LGSRFKDKKVVQMYNNVLVTQFETLSQNVVRKKWRLTVGLAAVLEFIERSARNRSPIEKLMLKLRTKS